MARQIALKAQSLGLIQLGTSALLGRVAFFQAVRALRLSACWRPTVSSLGTTLPWSAWPSVAAAELLEDGQDLFAHAILEIHAEGVKLGRHLVGLDQVRCSSCWSSPARVVDFPFALKFGLNTNPLLDLCHGLEVAELAEDFSSQFSWQDAEVLAAPVFKFHRRSSSLEVLVVQALPCRDGHADVADGGNLLLELYSISQAMPTAMRLRVHLKYEQAPHVEAVTPLRVLERLPCRA